MTRCVLGRDYEHESSDKAGTDADCYCAAEADLGKCWVGGLGIGVGQRACGGVVLWHCEGCVINFW
jgi:hypothetical protein